MPVVTGRTASAGLAVETLREGPTPRPGLARPPYTAGHIRDAAAVTPATVDTAEDGRLRATPPQRHTQDEGAGTPSTPAGQATRPDKRPSGTHVGALPSEVVHESPKAVHVARRPGRPPPRAAPVPDRRPVAVTLVLPGTPRHTVVVAMEVARRPPDAEVVERRVAAIP